MSEILFKCMFLTQKHGILKNNKQILYNRAKQTHFIGKSKDASECEKWLMRNLISQKIRQSVDTIDTFISVKILFYFPKTVFYTKKNEQSMKLPDIDNLLGMIFDCLQKSQIIKNDNLICSIDGTRRLPIDKTDYFIDIEITKFLV